MKALFFALLLVVSCSKEAEVSRDSFGIRVSAVTMDISQLDEIPWWIGAKRKEDKVTQSITFLIDMPKLKKKDLDYLLKERDVDSWLVRVVQVRGSKSQDLGSLLIPFVPRQHGRSSNTSASAHAAVKIYYAAAYASERMRKFKCPAFAHDKRVTKMQVSGDNDPFDIALGASFSYREKAQQVQLTPSSFNGGLSLTGQFYLEIAPYNTKKQSLMGSFKRIPRYVEILAEESVDVESCKGVHEELN